MKPSLTSTLGTGVVVPVRGFLGGKQRLGLLLDPKERAELLAGMADRVAAAAGARPVSVVTSAPEVIRWAEQHGLTVLADPGHLDDAAHAGVAWARALGLSRVVIAHADLPFAEDLGVVTSDGSRPVAVAVPCHRDDGTPVLSLPVGAGFRFSYGPGSFRRHAAEARRLGLGWRVVRDPRLSRDVDRPEDLLGLDLSYDLRTRFQRVPVAG
jgi:2-phospho-L-lactate guanylyltransferase